MAKKVKRKSLGKNMALILKEQGINYPPLHPPWERSFVKYGIHLRSGKFKGTL